MFRSFCPNPVFKHSTERKQTTDKIKLLILDNKTWNHSTVSQKMKYGLLKLLPRKKKRKGAEGTPQKQLPTPTTPMT